MIEFEESGMRFVFSKDDLFYIEKSSMYNRLCCNGVLSVECIVLKRKRVFLVEAKRSIPRADENEKKAFWEEIRKKVIHSLLIFYKELVEDNDEEIGINLRQAVYHTTPMSIVLIFNGFSDDACRELTEIYRSKISDIAKVNHAEVCVLNERAALRRGLIRE